MSKTLVALAGLALAAAANAQISITPGGLNAGNGNFANGTIPTSATGSGMSGANFRPGTTASTDSMFQNAWWFRVNNDTREYTFANTATAPFTMTGSTVGNNLNTLDTGGYDFSVANTSGGYSFNVQLRYQISNPGTGAVVTYAAVINNTGPTALNMALFNYSDFDANGTAGTDTWAWDGTQYLISDGPTQISYQAFGAAARQTTAFSTLRTALSNTTITNLDNTDAGSPGDHTGAFQWNLEIPVGGSATAGGRFAFIPAPSSVALLGLGGLLAARRRRA